MAQYNNLNFDFIHDIAPIVGLASVGGVVVVTPAFPAKTLPELITYARSNPNTINFGSGGIGTSGYLFGEMFQMMAGLGITHVPYRGDALALAGLLAGDIQLMFGQLSTSLEHLRAGKLRALAVTTRMRVPQLPDVPTVSEFLPGYEAIVWTGFGAPKGTPDEIVNIINEESNAGLADPMVKSRIMDLGGTILGGSPSEFTELIASEAERWTKVIKFAGVKAE